MGGYASLEAWRAGKEPLIQLQANIPMLPPGDYLPFILEEVPKQVSQYLTSTPEVETWEEPDMAHITDVTAKAAGEPVPSQLVSTATSRSVAKPPGAKRPARPKR